MDRRGDLLGEVRPRHVTPPTAIHRSRSLLTTFDTRSRRGSDLTEVIAALEDTVLSGGFRRLFRQVDGIVITAADDASNSASVPEAFIGGSDMMRRAWRVTFSVSGTSARDVERRLLARSRRTRRDMNMAVVAQAT